MIEINFSFNNSFKEYMDQTNNMIYFNFISINTIHTTIIIQSFIYQILLTYTTNIINELFGNIIPINKLYSTFYYF